ncbi:MAG TPA: hypothetical protein VLO09_01135 [Ornithinimicrobium sp.]|nr:hypothetical protein [Ornithinimicrobium sp.]
MKLPRLTATVALTSALALSACTGGDGSTDASSGDDTAGATSAGSTLTTADPDEDASTSTADADAATATADAAASTADADDEDSTVAMSTDEATAVMSVADAEQVAGTVLERRHAALQGDGEEVVEDHRMSVMGSARDAAEAADVLEDVNGEPAEAEMDGPAEPNVLAISREDGELPQFLLVQTVPDDGVPVLHLMESRTGEQEDFRIIWEAPMLPGTTVPTFDPRSVGTPVLREGRGELLLSPRDTLKEIAAYTSWPQPEEIPEYRTHGYSPAVRDAAEEQAAAVEGQATLAEKNWLISDDTKTLLFEDGSAFVLGTLLRDTTFTVEPNTVLTPPEAFTALAGTEEISEEAVLRTMVFMGVRVPAEGVEFTPEMIAVREQLVEAWGS